jgi:hypothetical protein
LTLDRLVDAAVSAELPDRLRIRVAAAAFSRAVVLQRDDAGARVAQVMRSLAPRLRTDLDRYLSAETAEDRHFAGVFLMLRAPGMSAMVRARDDEASYQVADPAMTFDRIWHRNWWCRLDERLKAGKIGEASAVDGSASSELIGLLYSDRRVPFPAFMADAERSAAQHEIEALAAAGAARSYLGAQALERARSTPGDRNVAEALAQTVQGWRFGCGDDGKWDIARQAFGTLHRLFPASDAAKRTKYWYK